MTGRLGNPPCHKATCDFLIFVMYVFADSRRNVQLDFGNIMWNPTKSDAIFLFVSCTFLRIAAETYN
jgi:hypothetical protein